MLARPVWGLGLVGVARGVTGGRASLVTKHDAEAGRQIHHARQETYDRGCFALVLGMWDRAGLMSLSILLTRTLDHRQDGRAGLEIDQVCSSS